MATLNTYFPATSRRIRRILAVGALALASTLALTALAPSGASAFPLPPAPANPGASKCLHVNEAPARATTPRIVYTLSGWKVTSVAQQNESTMQRLEWAVICRINEWRRANDLSALTLDANLRTAARRHSNDMAPPEVHFFHCSSPDRVTPDRNTRRCPTEGGSPTERVQATGYCGRYEFAYQGENIAMGRTPGDTVDKQWVDLNWENHPDVDDNRNGLRDNGHRENVLRGSANQIGVGLYLPYPGENPYYTAVFGRC